MERELTKKKDIILLKEERSSGLFMSSKITNAKKAVDDENHS